MNANYLLRMGMHVVIWSVVFLFVNFCSVLFFYEVLGSLGLRDQIAIQTASIGGFIVGMYWGHRIACDFVPLGPDGVHDGEPLQ